MTKVEKNVTVKKNGNDGKEKDAKKDKEQEKKEQEQKQKDIQEAQRRKNKDDYEILLGKVLKLKDMTDTEAWRDFYARAKALKAEARRQFEIVEKTRELLRLQETIRAVNVLFDEVSMPIKKLNDFCVGMPLFVSEFHTRAQWNAALGVVELSTSR